jgi:hypothetical protein
VQGVHLLVPELGTPERLVQRVAGELPLVRGNRTDGERIGGGHDAGLPDERVHDQRTRRRGDQVQLSRSRSGRVTAAEDRCPRCQARLFGASWCGQCGLRLTAGPEAMAAVGTATSAAPGFGRGLQAAEARARVSASAPALGPLRESRWRGTSTTFSGPTKVVITVVLIAIPTFPAVIAATGGLGVDPFLLAGDGSGWFMVAMILRSLWRKGRLH